MTVLGAVSMPQVSPERLLMVAAAAEDSGLEELWLHLDNVALDCPPTTPPPITAAATGPQTLRLSGELADATILTSRTTPDGVRAARARIEEGRVKAARTEPHRVIVNLLTATGPDAAERLTAAQQRNSGEHPPEAGVAGDAEAIADAVRRYAEAGADTVVLEPTDDDPDLIEFVGFAGTQVRPLMS